MLVIGDREGVLANWREAALRHGERILGQGRELIPLLGLVSEDPFDRVCFIIEANDKTVPARKEPRVVGVVIRRGVAVEPIPRKRIDELAGIIAALGHGLADDVRE